MQTSARGNVGATCYVFAVDSTGKYWNGTTFETYNVAHWSTYVVVAIEDAGSGYFVATLPAAFPVGTYALQWFEQVGASPSSADAPAFALANQEIKQAAGTPVVPGSGLNDLILDVRVLGHDSYDSNRITRENLKGKIDGLNTNFYIEFNKIIVGSVYISYDTTFRAGTGFTVDVDNGIITFAVAPNPTDTKSLVADYNFQWFTDNEITTFLYDAVKVMSLTDPTTIPSGLIPSLKQLSLHFFYQAKATQYAIRYASSGGGVGHNVDTVTKNFRDLAKSAYENGIKLLELYYQRAGQRNAPTSTTVVHRIDPLTPMR
jgi:hypothetical protein